MAVKIAVIGGGSAFVAGILNTMAERRDEVRGSSLVLQDIRPENQQKMLALGRNLFRARGADVDLSATLDLDEALQDADFVITCFRIGGYEALNLDATIPLKYGFYGDETSGAGGIFFACRTIPVVVDIARRMERLCPHAVLVNYANPTAFVADAVRRCSSICEISICSGFMGVANLAQQFLGLPREKVVPITAGVNHYTWLLHAYVDGRDVAPELLKAVCVSDTSQSGFGWKRTVELAQACGVLPIPGGHMADYFFRRESIAHVREHGHWGMTRPGRQNDPAWRHFEALAVAEDPQFDMSIPEMPHLVGSVSDLAVDLVICIANDGRKVFAVDMPNEGQITNMPRGEIVESPALAGSFGVLPFAVGDLPAALLPMTEMLCRSRKLAVDAALSGDRQTLLYALMADPQVDSLREARVMMEEMLAAQAKWLPQFGQWPARA
jgi:6-phospho-beta-glucosidase